MPDKPTTHLGGDGALPERAAVPTGTPLPGDAAVSNLGPGGETGDLRAEIEATLPDQALAADVGETALSDEEIDAYRRRVAEGFYNRRDLAAEVARRMLRRGDI